MPFWNRILIQCSQTETNIHRDKHSVLTVFTSTVKFDVCIFSGIDGENFSVLTVNQAFVLMIRYYSKLQVNNPVFLFP